MQTRKRIIMIKREIHTNDKRLMTLIDASMEHRRHIYNMGVEYIRAHDHRYGAANKKELYALVREYEKSDVRQSDRPACIRNTALRDLKEAVDKVWANRKKGVQAKLHFKRYNPNGGSVMLENKRRQKDTRMVSIVDRSTVKFKANRKKDFINFYMHHYHIHLKEPIVYGIDLQGRMYDNNKRYRFSNSDIREVGFLRKNKKYYIIIVAEVEFIPYKKIREPLAGLDLGIHTPIAIYAGDDCCGKFGFSNRVLAKLAYLERRAEKLQSIMSRKFFRNKELGLNPYSKNYEKVRYKFRRTWEKIYNIRRDWRFKRAHAIVTSFDCIVVDKFKQPDRTDENKSPKLAKINHANRLHAMCLFTETLEYMAYKYNCEFVEAPKGTTRTCSVCGYVNDKLPLSRRKLVCKCCGLKIDRDENAAKNCYVFGLER